MERCVLLILISTPGILSDSIQPKDKETTIYRTEEERVTLSCTYDTGSNYVYLYWYRQYPNREPEYLLYKGARTWSSRGNIPDTRFQSITSETSTELTIKSVTLSDSALYYCALRVAAQ
uniref:T-cell receptor alpha/delta variable 23.1.2 n=1 Tax=Sinocyclocheilus grahami TaxID=75366 RepID=A0A672Q1C0_SINGR